MTEAGQAAALAHVDRPALSDVELLCSQCQIHLGLHLHNHAPAAAMVLYVLASSLSGTQLLRRHGQMITKG